MKIVIRLKILQAIVLVSGFGGTGILGAAVASSSIDTPLILNVPGLSTDFSYRPPIQHQGKVLSERSKAFLRYTSCGSCTICKEVFTEKMHLYYHMLEKHRDELKPCICKHAPCLMSSHSSSGCTLHEKRMHKKEEAILDEFTNKISIEIIEKILLYDIQMGRCHNNQLRMFI